jgi:exopolyphosphatase/guanosine-5'-triphosphate,3'-diphosphate pyrophosphatase
VENLSRNPRRGALRAARGGKANGKPQPRAASRSHKSKAKGEPGEPREPGSAQGRLDHGPPVAVIDIGSNSVRLVVYEGLTRSLTPIFNEKVLAGLGREVQSTGLLATDAVTRALLALKRFRALCDTLKVERVFGIATAACRDARNGQAFIEEAERICRVKIDVLSGRREAQLAALGVMSGIYRPNGLVADLGGGSLELVDIRGERLRRGITLPLGGLALQDLSKKSIKKADKIVAAALQAIDVAAGKRRSLYAVGGTWRALARLHMAQTGYPLHVMHGYRIRAKEAIEFSELVRRVNTDTLSQIDVVAAARRPLLAYAALVLEHLVRRTKPSDVIISALGVREGLLYSMLSARERRRDPLIDAARNLNLLRSRSPQHGEELVAWTDRFFASSGIDETEEERRLRHAACLVADIGWRAHPDYRGEQSLNIISHASFVALDHPERAFLALSVYFRHVGVTNDDKLSPRLRELASTRLLDHARVLGAAMRVAYIISASMPGVLPRTPLRVKNQLLVLRMHGKYAALASDRVYNRLRTLARLIGREPYLMTD